MSVSKVKRGDDIVCRADDGADIWIRVTEFDDLTVTGNRGIPKKPGQKIKDDQQESICFRRDAILRFGRK